MERENRSSTFKMVVTVLLTVIALIIGWFAYQQYVSAKPDAWHESSRGYSYVDNKPMTVDGRMEAWNIEKREAYEYEIYLSLPPIILQEILEKLGPDAFIDEIVNDYIVHKKEYIQKQIIEQLPKIDITGPDADLVESAEISVSLKDRVPEQVLIQPIPAELPEE